MNAMIAEDPFLPAGMRRQARYARCVKMSKKNEWQIDRDLIRGRDFDFSRQLPARRSVARRPPRLPDARRFPRCMSQVQGRTYAYIFGLVERFISAKMLEQSRTTSLGDQTGAGRPRALLGRGDQAPGTVPPYRTNARAIRCRRRLRTVADAERRGGRVLGTSTWAVLALTCDIELFVQAHYDQSIAPREDLCPLWKDVFLFHWKDECQHVMLDELEWTAEHAKLTADATAIGRSTTSSDSSAPWTDSCRRNRRPTRTTSSRVAGRDVHAANRRRGSTPDVLAAYRWQYIVTGVQHVHFGRLLAAMTDAGADGADPEPRSRRSPASEPESIKERDMSKSPRHWIVTLSALGTMLQVLLIQIITRA